MLSELQSWSHKRLFHANTPHKKWVYSICDFKEETDGITIIGIYQKLSQNIVPIELKLILS